MLASLLPSSRAFRADGSAAAACAARAPSVVCVESIDVTPEGFQPRWIEGFRKTANRAEAGREGVPHRLCVGVVRIVDALLEHEITPGRSEAQANRERRRGDGWPNGGVADVGRRAAPLLP